MTEPEYVLGRATGIGIVLAENQRRRTRMDSRPISSKPRGTGTFRAIVPRPMSEPGQGSSPGRLLRVWPWILRTVGSADHKSAVFCERYVALFSKRPTWLILQRLIGAYRSMVHHGCMKTPSNMKDAWWKRKRRLSDLSPQFL